MIYDWEKEYRRWLVNVTEEERQELLHTDPAEVKENFCASLSFGTGGARGIMGLGPNRLNGYCVSRISQGVADYFSKTEQNCTRRGVVICYDTRNNSFSFALSAAKVFLANGFTTYFFSDVRPVPFCSFAVRYLNACCGVTVTASHNPKEYNGYKLYGGDGAQMSPDSIAKVYSFIEKCDYFNAKSVDLPVSDGEQIKKFLRDGKKLHPLLFTADRTEERYFDALYTTLGLGKGNKCECSDKQIKVVYTPLHGSGLHPVARILSELGVKLSIVEQQRLPNGNFPTVSVPNPEMPDALDLAIALAKKQSADIVLGTDPDCDRLGVAIRVDGDYKLLNGNQIAALLTDYVLFCRKRAGVLKNNGAIVKTIVTTQLCSDISHSYGVHCVDVLTGFKYIGEKICEWEKTKEYEFLFGCEESYGYLAGTYVRDKDGVAAAALFTQMTIFLQSIGKTVYQRLQELYKEYGFYSEQSASVTFFGEQGEAKQREVMQRFAKNEIACLGGEKVTEFSDFNNGVAIVNGKQSTVCLPKSDVILLKTRKGDWACIRPSGTEPKLKFYVGARGERMEACSQRARSILEQLLLMSK